MAKFTGYGRFYSMMHSIGAGDYIGGSSIMDTHTDLNPSIKKNLLINELFSSMDRYNVLNDYIIRHKLGKLLRKNSIQFINTVKLSFKAKVSNRKEAYELLQSFLPIRIEEVIEGDGIFSRPRTVIKFLN